MRASSNIRPTGVVVAEDLTSNQTASFQFDTVGFSGATVSVSARGTSATITGPTTLTTWMNDLLANNASIDFLFVGDSNTAYNAYGWVSGFGAALVNLGATNYGTMIHPCFRYASVQDVGYLENCEGDTAGASAGTGSGTAYAGSGRAPSALSSLYPVSSGYAPEGESGTDFLWVEGSSGTEGWYATLAGMYLDATNPMIDTTFRYRVLHSAGPGGGSFSIYIDRTGASDAFSSRLTTNAANWSWIASEQEITANAATTAANASFAYYTGNTGTSAGVKGNVGFAFQSCYRPNTKGFAVGSLHYRAGVAMSTISNNLESVTDKQLSLLLKEVNDRQIAASGLTSSRVCVVLQGGVNIDTGVPGSWNSNLDRQIKKITDAWKSAGLNEANLQFLAWVSQQPETTDALYGTGALRVAAQTKQLGDNRAERCTLVNLNGLIDFATLNGYADSGSTVHLTDAGYDAVGELILQAIIDRTEPSTAAFSTLKVYHSDDKATWTEFGAFQSLTAGAQSVTSQPYPRAVLSIDKAGRKRYLRVDVTPGGTSDVAAYAVMSGKADGIVSAADVNATLFVEG
jgi:hypothetical protein